MNFRRLSSLFLTFCFGLFLLLLGFIHLILPYSTAFQNLLNTWMLGKQYLWLIFGGFLALMGCIMMISAYRRLKMRSIQIKLDSNVVSIDAKIVQQYLDDYFKREFPNQIVDYQLKIKKQAMEILVSLPAVSFEDQKIIIEKIKQDLSHLFSQILGYPHHIQMLFTFR